MDKASEAIFSLRPVSFHYKREVEGKPQLGLMAEEVEKVSPALVLPDKEGQPYRVRYEAVNAMLLNEFLKEHRKVEQRATNRALNDGPSKEVQRPARRRSPCKRWRTLEASKLASQVAENNR